MGDNSRMTQYKQKIFAVKYSLIVCYLCFSKLTKFCDMQIYQNFNIIRSYASISVWNSMILYFHITNNWQTWNYCFIIIRHTNSNFCLGFVWTNLTISYVGIGFRDASGHLRIGIPTPETTGQGIALFFCTYPRADTATTLWITQRKDTIISAQKRRFSTLMCTWPIHVIMLDVKNAANGHIDWGLLLHSGWHPLILDKSLRLFRRSGPRLNIRTVFPRYGDSHVKDKTVVRSCYF